MSLLYSDLGPGLTCSIPSRTTNAKRASTGSTSNEPASKGKTLLERARGQGTTKSMRTIEWSWDRDPADAQYRVEYVFVLRENGEVRDVHVEGLFARAQ